MRAGPATAGAVFQVHGKAHVAVATPAGETPWTAGKAMPCGFPPVPDTCPGRTPASMFRLVRRIHGNGLRSRERRFESCRGHCSEA